MSSDLFLQQVFEVSPDCYSAINNMVQSCADTKHAHLEISLGTYADKVHTDFVSEGACMHIHDALAASVKHADWSSKGMAHSITMHYPDGVQRVFVAAGRNSTARRSIVHSVNLIVEQRNAAVNFTIVTTPPVGRQRAKNYHSAGPVCSVTLSEYSTFQHAQGWKYIVAKNMTGRSKEDACLATPEYRVTIRPPTHKIHDFRQRTATHTLVERGLDLLGRYVPQPRPPAAVTLGRPETPAPPRR